LEQNNIEIVRKKIFFFSFDAVYTYHHKSNPNYYFIPSSLKYSMNQSSSHVSTDTTPPKSVQSLTINQASFVTMGQLIVIRFSFLTHNL